MKAFNWFKACAIVLLFAAITSAQTPWNITANTAWYNESASTYTITTAEQLAGLALLVNSGITFEGKTITLGANIVLNDTSAQGGWRSWNGSTIGLRQWEPIGYVITTPFKGIFNGNGKVVRGLFINGFADNQGLFGVVSEGSVSNLGLAGFYVGGRANVGSIIGSAGTQYFSDGVMRDYGALIDSRDGKKYRTVVIGNQTWMAENLNYNASGSVCYKNDPANCAKYGRLYNWATVMALPSSCNNSVCASQVQSKHCGICPEGWHVPSDAEWTTLTDYVVGSSTVGGTKLKATSGWNDNGNGTDNYGFSALPGGSSDSSGDGFSFWWSSSERDANFAWYWLTSFSNSLVIRDRINSKSYLYSARCLKDGEARP